MRAMTPSAAAIHGDTGGALNVARRFDDVFATDGFAAGGGVTFLVAAGAAGDGACAACSGADSRTRGGVGAGFTSGTNMSQVFSAGTSADLA